MKKSFPSAVLLLILFLLPPFSFSQIINNYSVTNKDITAEILFKPVPHNVNGTKGKRIITFNDFADYSKPGEYALPSKELIFVLPSYSSVDLAVDVIDINRIEGTPLVNPEMEINEDKSIRYIEKEALVSFHKKAPAEIVGYFWYRDYYCVKIRVNQYSYNNGIIEEVLNARLSLTLKNPGNNIKVEDIASENEKLFLSEAIANFKYAEPLNKKLYEPAIQDSTWINFSAEYLKLGVNRDGIYRITRNDLQVYGINTSQFQLNTFKLIYRGKEQPVYVKDNGNNIFDDNEFIEFTGRRNWGGRHREISVQGEEYKEYLNRYTDTSAYWLTWGGAPGLRIDTVSTYTGIPADTINYYTEIVHYEENPYLDYSYYDLAQRQLPKWKNNQTWVWHNMKEGTRNKDFTVSKVVPGKTAKGFIKMQNESSNIFQNAHKVGLRINNDPTVYDSSYLNKYEQKVVKAEFNSNLLVNGQNTLKLISFPTANTLNTILVDWHEVEYPRELSAVNDSLKFLINDLSAKSLKYFRIKNLSNANVVLYKINNSMKKITNFNIIPVSGGVELVFADSVSPGDIYYVIKEDKIKSPVFYYKKQFSNLKDSNIRADYILLTHDLFVNKAAEYASFIEQQYKIKTKVVTSADVYDQFNYGFFSPEPIRDFLKAASENWMAPKPSYLFIAGDANYDYYNNKYKYNNAPIWINFVPSYGEPVSDIWFTAWDTVDALLPHINVGRVPFTSITEFDHFLNKHKKYAAQEYDDWNKYYLFFSSGIGDNEQELKNLKSINDSIINNMINPPPVSGKVNHLYKTYQPVTNFGPYPAEKIKEMIELGGVFTCYVGHSATQVWDNGIFDPSQLHNTRGKFSLMSDFGCSTARFAEPDIKSFSELFVNGTRGEAIGYTGNSSLGYLTPLPGLFYEQVLQKNTFELGIAHRIAKQNLLSKYGSTVINKIMFYSNHLISDPIIQLKIPKKTNLAASLKDIKTEKEFPDDSMDSLKVLVKYFNYGKDTDSVFSIQVTHSVNNINKGSYSFIKTVPGFNDSITVTVPAVVGNNQLSISLDNNGVIDEIKENDNNVIFTFNVVSSSARIMAAENINNVSNAEFKIVNPVIQGRADSLKFEISVKPAFTSPVSFFKSFDTVLTKVKFNGLQQGKRFWVRSKLANSSSDYGLPYSFVYDSTSKNSFYIGDTVSYKLVSLNDVVVSDSGIKLTNYAKHLRVSSAGQYDGSFAAVEINGNNYLPAGYFAGIHVAVFDSSLNFKYTKLFNVWDDPNFNTPLYKLLDSVTSNDFVCFAFCRDAGYGIHDSTKNLIRSFGSRYIGLSEVWASWAMIGKKGSALGTVPEGFAKRYNGRVFADTTLYFNKLKGQLHTSEFGPVKKWKKFTSDFTVYPGSSIVFKPLGIKSDGTADTLAPLVLNNGSADISSIQHYDKLSFIAEFSRTDSAAPSVKNIKVDYELLDEIGLSGQVVYVPVDTVLVGENVTVNYRVYNEGDSSTDSIKVRLERIRPDNSREIVDETVIPSLESEKYRQLSSTIKPTSGYGRNSFLVTIDPDNKQKELFKDNNVYSVPFFIKPDSSRPSVKVTFDGTDIIDGDYISARPVIRMELHDKTLLPVTDTSAFVINFDNKRVFFENNNDLKITFNSGNPKAVAEYSPLLKDGEHELTVQGKNSLGSLNDSSGVMKKFQVSGDAKLMEVFNYPNPLKNDTWFTFKLTQVPDELKIKIFTIAGRLIKEISRKKSELNYDFNRIYWNGRDEDGDELANGVYIYKVIMTAAGKTETALSKIAVMK